MRLLEIFRKQKREREAKAELERQAVELLNTLNVYPWGVKKDQLPVFSAERYEENYVDFVRTRPRVQVSSKTAVAKRILNWQLAASNAGYRPASFEVQMLGDDET